MINKRFDYLWFIHALDYIGKRLTHEEINSKNKKVLCIKVGLNLIEII